MKSINAHVKYDCGKFGHLTGGSGPGGPCWLCDGGLFMCGVCGQAEVELTKECPGPCTFCGRRYEQHKFDPEDHGCAKFESERQT